jgi:hypothetical protein
MNNCYSYQYDCLCLVVGYRSRDPGFDSQCYQIFWEVVVLEGSPLSIVLLRSYLNGKVVTLGLENQDNGCVDPLFWPHDTLYLQKVGTNFTDMWRSLCRYSSLALMLWSLLFFSSVGIATGYRLDDRGVGVLVPEGSRIFSSRRPDWLWGPPNLLSNEYPGLFPRG